MLFKTTSTPRPIAADALAIQHDAEAIAALFPALMMQATHTAQTVTAGFHGRRRAGPGESFWQHRPYAQTDPVQAIDWRQSARAGDRLYVRQNEWETAASVWFWRDPSPSLNYAWTDPSSKSVPPPTKRLRADVLTIAAAILLTEAGERIGLMTGGFSDGWPQMRGPFQGRRAPGRLLEALLSEEIAQHPNKSPNEHKTDQPQTSAKAPAKTQPAQKAIPAPNGAKAIFLSDFFTDPSAIENAARRLSKEGVSGAFIQVIDPSEEVFPFTGRTEFHDIEGAERLTIADAGALAKAYRTRFNAHRARLEQTAHTLGWTFIAHRTDNPAQTALLALYAALADPKATTHQTSQAAPV